MAYHYTEPGYSPIVVGATYKRRGNFWWGSYAHLRKHNEATGICLVVSEHGTPYWVSAAELSNWTLLAVPIARTA